MFHETSGVRAQACLVSDSEAAVNGVARLDSVWKTAANNRSRTNYCTYGVAERPPSPRHMSKRITAVKCRAVRVIRKWCLSKRQHHWEHTELLGKQTATTKKMAQILCQTSDQIWINDVRIYSTFSGRQMSLQRHIGRKRLSNLVDHCPL